MKLGILTVLFAAFMPVAHSATNMVLYPAGVIPAGTSLTVATTQFDQYYATMQANAAKQTMLAQQAMLQTQLQGSAIMVAQASFAQYQQDKRIAERQKRKEFVLKTTQDTPYYKEKLHTTDDDTTPVEETAVPPTKEEAVTQIAEVQKSLDKVAGGPAKPEDCDNTTKKDTPTFSDWDEYIKNIEDTAKAAKPPVSPQAVAKTVAYLKANRAKLEKTLQNRNYVVINDFTQDSTKKRMLVLDLKTKTVERYLVSHGLGKGFPDSATAPAFSDSPGSQLTPAGFLVMKNETSSPKWKKKIILEGLEPRNKNSKARDIVFHGGPVSEDEVKKFKMLGFSQGCMQVPRTDYEKLNRRLQDGVLMYNFTPSDQ